MRRKEGEEDRLEAREGTRKEKRREGNESEEGKGEKAKGPSETPSKWPVWPLEDG